MINSMSYKGYTASMVFDAEDKVIVGRVQDIDDIISFHGESVAEFESNFHAAIGTTWPRPRNSARCRRSQLVARSCFASHPKFMRRRLRLQQGAAPASTNGQKARWARRLGRLPHGLQRAAKPNPSLKLTRYGRHCKPDLRYFVHCLSPGLQYPPPWPA